MQDGVGGKNIRTYRCSEKILGRLFDLGERLQKAGGTGVPKNTAEFPDEPLSGQ